MAKPKLTPWFNAQKQPPVNGGDYADYEWRCFGPGNYFGNSRNYGPEKRGKNSIIRVSVGCAYCEWRGLAGKEA